MTNPTVGKVFDHVVVVFLENEYREAVLANPYMNALRNKGVFMANAEGVTHPSQPNYIATIAGSLMGINNDSAQYVSTAWDPAIGSYNFDQKITIVDQLEEKYLSWKCYAEDLPIAFKNLTYDITESPQDNASNLPSYHFPFARRHVPFLSFPSIVSNPDRLANIVDATELHADLSNSNLPNFSFYTPNLVNDGHSSDPQNPDKTHLENIENFLKTFLGNDPISKFPPKTLIVITFDEAYPYQRNGIYNNDIYTLLIGDFLKQGTTNTDADNHYTLLRSIQDNFKLGTLPTFDNTPKNDPHPIYHDAKPYWFLRGAN